MITYCTNIHPGENWDDTFRNLKQHLIEVKAAVSPDSPFPVGLRLSSLASHSIDAPAFSEWLTAHDLFVPTINGFPFGSFHTIPVKDNVYRPDWRSRERMAYSCRLATLLDSWLPAGVTGSVSSVPLAFGRTLSPEEYAAIRKNLLSMLEHLDRLRQKSGKLIILSLEPEPGCILETTDDVLDVFDRMNFADELKRGIGVCFDCCHHAVEFEEPQRSIRLLKEAGITIGKVQVSSAPCFHDPEHSILEPFCEPCYLHQTVIRSNTGYLKRYNDLPDAMLNHIRKPGDEWRIHFHIPVFSSQTAVSATTQDFIIETLRSVDRSILREVETYTWDVLPQNLRCATVTESIIRELQWLKALES